ncbi:hypothetical protein TSOC_003187, partial [Tetrabaena socialis]
HVQVTAATSKDAVAELKHIHGAADKLVLAGEPLQQAVAVQAQKLEELQKTLAEQGRVRSLQAALQLVPLLLLTYTKTVQYRGSSNAYDDATVKRVLLNELRGTANDVYGKHPNTAAAYRTALSNHLHELTRTQPRMELGPDGKRYLVTL